MRLSNLKKWYVISGLVIFTLVIGIFIVNATIMHSGHDFEISIDGADESLQNIITENDFTIPHTYTMPSTIPDPGHGPDEIWVSVNGSEMTLQDAISTIGLCGITSPTTSYSSPNIPNPIHFATEIDVSSGTTLQDAINSGELVSVNGNWTVWSGWSHPNAYDDGAGGTCSVSCGGGTQTRTRTCTNPAPYCAGIDCVGDNSESRACNTQVCCTYSWYTGSCSVTCGGGTRTVYCRCDGTQVSDSYCSGTKPSTTCNTQPCCTYSWYTGSWSTCPVECGGGTQTRTVYCRCDGTQVSDSYCSGTKPSTSQTCNTATDKDGGSCTTSGCYEGVMDYDCVSGQWQASYCAATTPYTFVCSGGQVCYGGSCCTPNDCPSSSEFPCGSYYYDYTSAGCGVACTGYGTYCPSPYRCWGGECLMLA